MYNVVCVGTPCNTATQIRFPIVKFGLFYIRAQLLALGGITPVEFDQNMLMCVSKVNDSYCFGCAR